MSRYGAVVPVCLALTCPSLWAQDQALSEAHKSRLFDYARDTWRSMDAMKSPGELPTDHLTRTEAGWEASTYTSPTNIAAYLWSTIAAEQLGFLTPGQASESLRATIESVQKLERHQGFFFNWYDTRTLAKLRVWPSGAIIKPFLSTVDNGWLAASLHITAKTHPELASSIAVILSGMNFAFFYDPYNAEDPETHPGLLRGGYFPDQKRFTGFHYGMLNTEPRIVSYLGIASRQLPPEHYGHMKRGQQANALPVLAGDEVPHVLPSWDGTMFEALMVSLFVPEASWGPWSWGMNHPRYVHTQIEYAMSEAKLGYWGISASGNPDGGYAPYGVKRLATSPRARNRNRVVTPHASFLAMAFAPREALANLDNLSRDFPLYGNYGFFDSVDVVDGRVSNQVLSLDQGMILAAIVNALNNNFFQTAFSEGLVEFSIRPLMAAERFFLTGLGTDTSTEMRTQPTRSEPLRKLARFEAGSALLAKSNRRLESRRTSRKMTTT